MKTRRFILFTGLSFATVGVLGCARESATQQPLASAVEATPKPATSAAPSSQAQTAPSPQDSILSSGSFVSGEHPTQGTAQVVTRNNQRYLQLDQSFVTSSLGPDLVVILHRLADVIGSTTPPAFAIKEGDYVLLAPLTSYTGAQSYPIPDSINLDDFKSAAIWCRQFNATFGAATLAPQS